MAAFIGCMVPTKFQSFCARATAAYGDDPVSSMKTNSVFPTEQIPVETITGAVK
ncbi:hypothetical protein KIN20_016650 [Parelaphostrongylus tenuis]|uniref:Uncharacterized protein n=1 Tax=Parelaphostrongylus tenuis TaxID=148309 RepID=A0AAD5MGR2_PARTN|nr:hypothetical protein KIN20_016650 [Parelaphostrongylus tenuis]